MALNDTTIRNLKPDKKPYKKSDGGGLYLLVMPEASKLWRLAYRFAGKQKTISLGSYPDVTLAMAREAKAEARRLLSQGVDPSEKRKADKRAAAAARTFGEVADEWFETKREREAKSEATLKRDRWLMGEWKSEIDRRPMGEIEPLSKENLSWRGCCPLRKQELAMMETYRLEQTTQFVLVDLLVSPVSIWKK